jgi:hypothetical protein
MQTIGLRNFQTLFCTSPTEMVAKEFPAHSLRSTSSAKVPRLSSASVAIFLITKYRLSLHASVNYESS